MVFYARRQQKYNNALESRQKHIIKHKEEHNTQKDKKYTKLNYKTPFIKSKFKFKSLHIISAWGGHLPRP